MTGHNLSRFSSYWSKDKSSNVFALPLRARRLAWLGRQKRSFRHALTRRRSPVQIRAGPPNLNTPFALSLAGREKTNYPLLAFGLILIFVGALTGSIFVVLFGLFILLPALTRSRRKSPTIGRPPQTAPPVRYAPPATQPEVPARVTLPPVAEDRRASGPYAPMFPAPFLPMLNSPSTSSPVAPEVSPASAVKPEQRDEVLEMIALLGLLGLLSRRR